MGRNLPRIQELPATTQPLFEWILDRLEKAPQFCDASGRPNGRELVRHLGTLFAASRHGLSYRELTGLLEEREPKGIGVALAKVGSNEGQGAACVFAHHGARWEQMQVSERAQRPSSNFVDFVIFKHTY